MSSAAFYIGPWHLVSASRFKEDEMLKGAVTTWERESISLWEQQSWALEETIQDWKGQLSRRNELLEIAGTTMATRAPSGKCGEEKRLENFPEVAQRGGGIESTITVAIPQAHMVLDIIKAEAEKNRGCSHVIHRKTIRSSLQDSSVLCVPGRLGSRMFMKPVGTEHMFSFWGLLVPGAEWGAGRQVGQAGGLPWWGQSFGPQLCSS